MEPLAGLGAKIATHAAEAGVEVAKDETKSFLAKILGQPAEVIGELWALPLRERMFNNLVDVVSRAQAKLKEAGISPNQVPLKVIHPLLEAAALEEDDDLLERWANLLARSVDPETSRSVNAAHVHALKELGVCEVRLLDGLAKAARDQMMEAAAAGRQYRRTFHTVEALYGVYITVGLSSFKSPKDEHDHTEPPIFHTVEDREAFWVTVALLQRHRILIDQLDSFADDLHGRVHHAALYKIGAFGRSLIKACAPPQPKPAS